MKVISIVGTRLQFLKLAPITYQMNKHPEILHIIIHTGQHYDKNMSEELFENLEISQPQYFLNINNSTHAKMTGKMLIEIEEILIKENPDYVLVYGDCDTTLAGALSAKKLGIKLVHIESGLRSYNMNMPEELNRRMVDHISDILLCPMKSSIETLRKENLTKNVHYIGNLQL